MKLPIRNRTASPLTLFIEPNCHQFEIPPEGEAIVTLDDGPAHSLDFHSENWVSLWNEGGEAVVDIVSKEQQSVVDALNFARMWLFQYGSLGEAAAKELDDAVKAGERARGYVETRFAVYRAFRVGFRAKAAEAEPSDARLPDWSGGKALAGAYRAGGVAAYCNYRTRLEPKLIELGEPPFDTEVALEKFSDADAVAG
jgi:hypothetical protein